tara:strand:+ start:4603 stop:6834 length:2232 start_codon:yes stop_codon:yes gene_type:complete
MPSNRSERKQRHLAQVKQSTGKAQKGKKVTENVPGSGYRETQYIGGKKYYSPLSTDPNLSITGSSSTNITISGGSIAAPSGTNIHSELQNLSTDDHTQYVHNTVARTISAVHTFTGNVIFSGEPQVTDMSISNPTNIYTSLNHDNFTGFVANEHIDWTNTSSNFSTSGTVGGGVATFTSVKSPSLTTAASTAMTINPTTDLILNPTDAIIVGKNSPSNPVNISSDPFSSGFTGAGWRLTPTSFETTDMVLRGTLSVYELLIQQVRATNGSIFVSATGKVATVNSQTEVVFEDPSGHSVTPFAVNDILLMQRVSLDSSSVVKRIFAKVTNVNGLTLTLGAVTGAPSNTGSIEEGDEFVRIGNTNTASRQGGVYLTADDSGAPFIDIFSGVTSYATWNSTNKVKARLGRLDGITDTDAGLSGSQSNYFGLYSNNVHLKGTIFAQDGEIGGWDITSSAISAVVDGNTKVALEKDGDVKIFSDLDGSTRHGLFLFETGGNHLSDWWTIFHDDDSTNSGEFVFNYEGSNKFKITRTGEVNQPANTEFKITNDRVRLTIDQDDTGYYEIYGTDTGVVGDQTLGGIRWYTSESGTYGSAWNASITARVQTQGEMGLVFRAGGDTTATDYYWNFHFQGGSYNGANTTTWNQSSDERVKENKVSIGNGLNIIKNLNPISYKFKESFLGDSHLKDVKRWGFSAQEFKTVIPEAVSTTAEYGYDDFHSLNVDMLIPMLVAAVKELSAKVEALEG